MGRQWTGQIKVSTLKNCNISAGSKDQVNSYSDVHGRNSPIRIKKSLSNNSKFLCFSQQTNSICTLPHTTHTSRLELLRCLAILHLSEKMQDDGAMSKNPEATKPAEPKPCKMGCGFFVSRFQTLKSAPR